MKFDVIYRDERGELQKTQISAPSKLDVHIKFMGMYSSKCFISKITKARPKKQSIKKGSFQKRLVSFNILPAEDLAYGY